MLILVATFAINAYTSIIDVYHFSNKLRSERWFWVRFVKWNWGSFFFLSENLNMWGSSRLLCGLLYLRLKGSRWFSGFEYLSSVLMWMCLRKFLRPEGILIKWDTCCQNAFKKLLDLHSSIWMIFYRYFWRIIIFIKIYFILGRVGALLSYGICWCPGWLETSGLLDTKIWCSPMVLAPWAWKITIKN